MLYHTTQPLEPRSQDSGRAVVSPIAKGKAPQPFDFAQSDVSEHCVVDTGCQRTAVGSNVLARIVAALPTGMQVRYEKRQFQFKGVGGITKTNQIAVIPISLGSRPAIIRAAVLDEPADAPLLFSLPILKALGAVIDLADHHLHLRSIAEKIPISFNSRGQLCIRLFDFSSVQQNMTDMPWKPKKMIGDECTVFYQSECGSQVCRSEVNSASEADVIPAIHAPGRAEQMTSCYTYHDSKMQDQTMIPHVECDETSHCSSVPVKSSNSTVDLAVVHHGGRRTPQTQLCEPESRRCQQACSNLASHGHQDADQGAVAHGMECHVQSHDAGNSVVEPSADANVTCRRTGIPGGNVRSSSGSSHGEERADAETNRSKEARQSREKEQAPETTARPGTCIIRSQPEFHTDSRQPQSCHTSHGEHDVSQCSSQDAESGVGFAPTVLLWAPMQDIHMSTTGSKLWESLPPLSTDSEYSCTVPLFHVAGTDEVPTVRESVKPKIAIGCSLKQAWKGTWDVIEPSLQEQQQRQEKEVKDAIHQQLKQQLLRSSTARPRRIKPGSWTFLSSSMEPPRHQLSPGDEDMQAL